MKSIKNITKYILIFPVVMFSITGCEDFLDINKSPNSPSESRLDLVLPSVQAVIFESIGNGNAGLSDLTSQFVHHITQRGESNFYFVAGNEFNISNAWPNLYAGALKDIDGMIDQATELNSPHYLGIAKVLKAYTYSIMVDAWGMAAYEEFGQGTANPFAKLDDGAEIYPKLFTLLDEAVASFGETSPVDVNGDLIYDGDIDQWTRLANSLKLKLYNQVRMTPLYDAAAVNAAVTAIDTDPDAVYMSAVEDGFRLRYSDSNNPENRHPLFLQDYVNAKGTSYIDPYFYLIMDGSFPNGTVLNDVLQGIQDPRIPYYFFNQLAGDDPQNPTTSAYWGDFLSIWFASFNIDPNEGFDQADSQTLVGLYPAGGSFDDAEGGVGDADSGLKGAGYTRLYPYFAHLYTLAELMLTQGAPGDPREYFENAMIASFDEVNDIADLAGVTPIDDVDRDAYIADVLALYDGASAAGKLELIMTEKWIASFGFTVDAWTDYRRTGYPLLFDPTTDNNPVTILNRNYPVSLPYFIDDLQINPNSPPQRNPGADKVFWDIN